MHGTAVSCCSCLLRLFPSASCSREDFPLTPSPGISGNLTLLEHQTHPNIALLCTSRLPQETQQREQRAVSLALWAERASLKMLLRGINGKSVCWMELHHARADAARMGGWSWKWGYVSAADGTQPQITPHSSPCSGHQVCSPREDVNVGFVHKILREGTDTLQFSGSNQA